MRWFDALVLIPVSQFISWFAMSVTTPNECDVGTKPTLIGPTSLQFNPRSAGGGKYYPPPPLPYFLDSSKPKADIATLSVPYPASI